MSPHLRSALASLLLVSATGVAAAQTTGTERQAARSVLDSIAQLQTRIAPTRLAQSLATKADADRDAVLLHTADYWTGLQGLSDWIAHNPEVGFKEFKAVDTLVKVLRAAGFTVETPVAGLQTAFVATWNSPAGSNGPTLGLIGEYDALRGTQGAFHGDQHNAQTPVAIAAARALMDYMRDKHVQGRIKLFGTPAEEVGPPTKTIMQKAGLFQGTDILVRSHSLTQTTHGQAGFGVCCLNINEVKYVFKGAPSHQLSSWNGRNALEAAVMFYTAVDRLRTSLRPEASMQGVIPEGGIAPNVVPDRAAVDFYLRYPDEVYLAHMDTMVTHAALGSAMATGTIVELQRNGEYRDGISLGTLEELTYAYEKKLGAPKLVDEPGRPNGYEETGFLSRDVPGVGVTVASSDYANHTYQMTDDNFTDKGHNAFRMDAQVEAAVLYHFLTDANFRAQVKAEHARLQGLFDQYLASLRATYSQELSLMVSP